MHPLGLPMWEGSVFGAPAYTASPVLRFRGAREHSSSCIRADRHRYAVLCAWDWCTRASVTHVLVVPRRACYVVTQMALRKQTSRTASIGFARQGEVNPQGCASFAWAMLAAQRLSFSSSGRAMAVGVVLGSTLLCFACLWL